MRRVQSGDATMLMHGVGCLRDLRSSEAVFAQPGSIASGSPAGHSWQAHIPCVQSVYLVLSLPELHSFTYTGLRDSVCGGSQ